MENLNFIPELQKRGLLQDIIPGTEEQLSKEITSCYVGFDPTADSLHIGSLLPIIVLMHLQKAGHKPYALIGGATGMIGDPSGKSAERNLLDMDTIDKNVLGIKSQLSKFLNFDGDNGAVVVNNHDWFKEFSFLDFVRDIGKKITVNYMLSKDSVQKRLETGMSFTEFTYQLIQGYDFQHLNSTHNVKLQFGGSDQWGNIVTGTELIRKISGNDVYAFTCPLLMKSDGTKFGKSADGNVWLDRNKTSPYKFYQYWLNQTDDDSKKLIKIFTFIPLDEIDALINEHNENPNLRILQNRLADELTLMVHSKEDLELVKKASAFLFTNGGIDEIKSDKKLFDVICEAVPKVECSIDLLSDMTQLLTDSKITPSKNEARKMIRAGAVSVNKSKFIEGDNISQDNLLHNNFLLIQKGKKAYYVVELNS